MILHRIFGDVVLQARRWTRGALRSILMALALALRLDVLVFALRLKASALALRFEVLVLALRSCSWPWPYDHCAFLKVVGLVNNARS